MQTQFTLSKDEVAKLLSFESHGKDIISNSTNIFVLNKEQNQLDLLFLGADGDLSAKYQLEIANLETDVPEGQLNYYLADVSEFAVTANKVIKGADSITIRVMGDDTTATNIKNEVTKTEISIVNHDKLTDNKVKRIIQSFSDLNNCFIDETYVITPTVEFISIMETICRSMRASGYELNSAMIRHNIIRYCDPQGILTYTLKDDICPYDKDIYIQDSLVKLLSSFIKDGITLTFDKTNTYAKIEIPGRLFIIIALSENIFQYPTEEELAIVNPDPASMIKLKVKKSDLLEAIGTFDGVFRAELWKWCNLVFDASESYLSESKVYLSHMDSNAMASNYLPVQVIERTDTNETCKFLIGSSYVKDMLNRMSDDEVEMSFSSGEIGVPHGTGFILSDSTLKVTCIKIINSDA